VLFVIKHFTKYTLCCRTHLTTLSHLLAVGGVTDGHEESDCLCATAELLVLLIFAWAYNSATCRPCRAINPFLDHVSKWVSNNTGMAALRPGLTVITKAFRVAPESVLWFNVSNTLWQWIPGYIGPATAKNLSAKRRRVFAIMSHHKSRVACHDNACRVL